MKRKIIIISVLIIIIIAIVLGANYIIAKGNKDKKMNYQKNNSNLNVVLSLEDDISENTAWCGTFNLIWNDLKNDIAKQDIIFSPQLKVIENLNKGTFNSSYLSEDSYYKVYGNPTLKLKKQIEKEIKEKFDETSDILDDFNWNDNENKDYFLYAMLKKEFKFPKVFTKLNTGTFGNYKNVKYFGINSSTPEGVREQVKVLYYDSKDSFAVKLLTNSNEEVIISKGNDKENFNEVYDNINQKSENYKGSKDINNGESLRIPNIDFNLKKEFQEIENKKFSFANGDVYQIEKAVQTIQFSLDENGGKIKSEAGMKNKLSLLEPTENREFIVDNTFDILLKEKDKEKPYFAARISDISQVQNDVQKE